MGPLFSFVKHYTGVISDNILMWSQCIRGLGRVNICDLVFGILLKALEVFRLYYYCLANFALELLKQG